MKLNKQNYTENVKNFKIDKQQVTFQSFRKRIMSCRSHSSRGVVHYVISGCLSSKTSAIAASITNRFFSRDFKSAGINQYIYIFFIFQILSFFLLSVSIYKRHHFYLVFSFTNFLFILCSFFSFVRSSFFLFFFSKIYFSLSPCLTDSLSIQSRKFFRKIMHADDKLLPLL